MKPTIRQKLLSFFSQVVNGKLVRLIGLGMVLFVLGACQSNQESVSGESAGEELSNQDSASRSSEEEAEPEETFSDIRITAVGDVMGHTTQITSVYNPETDSYNFNTVFEHVKPIIEEADLALANLETTLAGPSLPYAGYPTFNTPDEIIDGLAYAGFDTIVTTNNHSLDTREEGLRRTAQVIREKGLNLVGTYESEESQSRVLMKDVEGIKVAILAYTEALNGLEAQYSTEKLNSMVNIMDEDQIIADMEEAKEEDPDLILAYMHWGNEYASEPSEIQTSYAELLTREGIDIILGSHPHVIQRTDWIESEGNEAFVAYSMGNFVSNQRRESLGEGFEPTEDGAIINIDVQKNEQTGETTIQNIEMVPTWVYRYRNEGDSEFTYRILPAEAHLEDPDLPAEIINRLQSSYERTTSRMNLDSAETE